MITLKLDTEISNVTIQLELSKDQIYQQEQNNCHSENNGLS